MEDLAELWRDILGKEPPRKTNRYGLYEEKVKLLRRLPAGIFRGDENQSFSKEELENLLAPLTSRLTAQTCVYLTRFISRGLSKGKRSLGWKVALPLVPHNIPRERSRFDPHKFAELQSLRRVEEAFYASFANYPVLKTEHLLGRLILSAILNGGLLQLQWLDPWVNALNKRVCLDGTCLWLDLEKVHMYPHKKNEGEDGARRRSAEKSVIMNRRWFADPISKTLILQWLAQDNEKNLPGKLPNPFLLVKGFLTAIKVSPQDIPTSATNLLARAETRLGLVVSPFLASYATGSLNGVSLPRETWARLCCGKIVERNSKKQQDETQVPRHWRNLVMVSPEDMAPLEEQQLILKKIRKILDAGRGNNKNRAKVRRELALLMEQTRHELCPLLTCLAAWLDFNLASKSQTTAATPSRYLSSIGNVLLAVFGRDNLLEFEAGDFIVRYDRAIEAIKGEEEKGRARSAIGRFHAFLANLHEAPRIYQGYFYQRSGPPEITVDANLLSQGEFDRLKDALGWGDSGRSRTATAAILIAMLGFRCGLRRNEVYKLRVKDIQGRSKPELLLRATARRSLKSDSATRRLPIHILMPEDEVDFLRSWLQQFPEPLPETLLFCAHHDKPFELIPESFVFPQIRKALAMVTGDASLHFHHLRHSFACWLLIRLAGNVTSLRGAANFLDHAEFSGHRIQEIRSFLLGNEYLGRKGAFAVSLLLGHADLATTFTSYFHLCDWLLCRDLSAQDALPSIDVDVMTNLTGLSRATVYRSKLSGNSEAGYDKDGELNTAKWNWDMLFRKPREPEYRDPLLAHAREYRKKMVVFAEEPAPDPVWKTLQWALDLVQVNLKSVPEVAKSVGVSEEQIETWLSRVESIMEKRHGLIKELGQGRLRHIASTVRNVTRRPRDRKDPTEKKYAHHHNRTQKHVFPKKPVEKGDKKLAEMMLKNFEKLSMAEKNKVLLMVDYFIETFSTHKGTITFTRPRQAKEFIEALGFLGITQKLLQLVELCGKAKATASTERRIYWEKSLGLKRCTWILANRGYGAEKWPGVIGLRVLSQVKEGMVQEGSYGFRYAMYILAIGYWIFP